MELMALKSLHHASSWIGGEYDVMLFNFTKIIMAICPIIVDKSKIFVSLLVVH